MPGHSAAERIPGQVEDEDGTRSRAVPTDCTRNRASRVLRRGLRRELIRGRDSLIVPFVSCATTRGLGARSELDDMAIFGRIGSRRWRRGSHRKMRRRQDEALSARVY